MPCYPKTHIPAILHPFCCAKNTEKDLLPSSEIVEQLLILLFSLDSKCLYICLIFSRVFLKKQDPPSNKSFYRVFLCFFLCFWVFLKNKIRPIKAFLHKIKVILRPTIRQPATQLQRSIFTWIPRRLCFSNLSFSHCLTLIAPHYFSLLFITFHILQCSQFHLSSESAKMEKTQS